VAGMLICGADDICDSCLAPSPTIVGEGWGEGNPHPA